MRLIMLIVSLVLSGCVSVTINLGGTVNNVSVNKASGGEMFSGGTVADETNSNDGKLVLPLR